MKQVVLIGASGFVGKTILHELLSRGYEVTAVVRDASKLEPVPAGVTVVEADVADSAKITEICRGKEAVISALNPGGWGNANVYADTLLLYPALLNAVKAAGV